MNNLYQQFVKEMSACYENNQIHVTTDLSRNSIIFTILMGERCETKLKKIVDHLSCKYGEILICFANDAPVYSFYVILNGVETEDELDKVAYDIAAHKFNEATGAI